MSQKNKYITNNILWTLISTVLIGSMLQTFLLEKGFSNENVGNYVSVMQFIQLAVIVVFSKIVDKIKNIIKLTSLSSLLYLPLIALMWIMCFGFNSNILIIVFGILAYFSIGVYNVLAYKIPYQIMDITNYGKWTGVSGEFAAIFLLVLTYALSLVQNKIGYFSTMKFFYPVVFIGVIMFSVITALYKPIGILQEEKAKVKIAILKYKPFTSLIIPNLFRGFCSGIIAMAVTIGYSTNQLNATTASILLVVTQTVSIPANLIYTKFTSKDPFLILFCSIGILASVSAMGFLNSTGFLICYGFAYFFMMIVNVAVPVFVTKIVDYNIVGEYNGWRILLNSGGTFLASALCVPMLNAVGSKATWIISGVLQVICGISYFIYFKKNGLLEQNIGEQN